MSATPPSRAEVDAGADAAGPISSGGSRLALLSLVVLAIAVRVVTLHAWPPEGLTGDEQDYVELAKRWADTGEFTNLGRAPGYVWFLGPIFRLTGHSIRAAQYVQIALAGLSVALVYKLGRSAFRPSVALLAAAMFALDPALIAYSHYLFNETLYIALLLAAAVALLRGVGWVMDPPVVRGSDTPSGESSGPNGPARMADGSMTHPTFARTYFCFALCGLLLGSATLVKGLTTPHLAVLAAWLLVSHKAAARFFFLRAVRVTILVTCWAIVVLPYGINVYQRTGHFVLVDVSAARTLWHANRLDYQPGYDWRITPERVRAAERRYGIRQPSLERETPDSAAAMMREESAFLRDHAGMILARVPEKWAALWNPTNYLQRRIARGQVVDLPRESAAGKILGIGSTVFYAITLFLAVLGLWHARPGPLRAFTLLTLAVYLLTFAVMVSFSRYRLPLMPFLFVFAADAALNLRGRLCLRSWRTWASLATIALLAVSWYPYRDYALMRIDEPRRERGA